MQYKHDCIAGVATCTPATLCARCYQRELASRRPQARAIGQMWAERICRGELRGREAWPTEDPKTIAIARRKVAQLARDPRLLELFAVACSEGAAAWWAGRPAKYRL